MEVSKDGFWVPPLRKYSGVPSLAAFRRAALTPWNSQDDGNENDSPPESPRHHSSKLLYNGSSKTRLKKLTSKETSDTTEIKQIILNESGHVKYGIKENESRLSVNQTFKRNLKADEQRRVKSCEPLASRKNIHGKIANSNCTDGRDSISLNTNNLNKTKEIKSPKQPKITPNSKQQKEISSDQVINKNISDIEDRTTIFMDKSKSEHYNSLNKPEKNKGERSQDSNYESADSEHEYLNTPNSKNSKNSLNRPNDSRRNSMLLEVPGSKPTDCLSKKKSFSSSKIDDTVAHKINDGQSSTIEDDSAISEMDFEIKLDDASCDDLDEVECFTDDKSIQNQEIDPEESWMSTKGDLDDGSSDPNDDSQDKDGVDTEDENDKSCNDDLAKPCRVNPSIPAQEEEEKDNQNKKDEDVDVASSKASPLPQQMKVHGVTLTREKLKRLRAIVDKAAQRKKVFTIFGKYPSIREALVSRGWVQNFDLQKLTNPHSRHNDNEVSVYARLRLGPGVGEEELALISRMLRDTPVHFVWIMGDTVDWKSLSKSTIVSRFPRVYFTTKVGLCSYLEESHWFCEASVSNVNFPRCYTTDDLTSFIKDFRLTACLGLIRTVIAAIDNKQPNIFSGKIPLSAIRFAVKRCSEFVSVEEHEDIDMESEERVWDHQWDQFLTYYYQLILEGETFVPATDVQIEALYTCCEAAINGVKPYWPQMEMDGVSNLWLVKPGAKSRGRGISVCNKLERIMAKLGSSHQPSTDINPPASSSRFVIQKYVERPLLIYNTKFDIRQWFLVTSAYPLTIWMYKESYLRFCSQLFSLSNLHESVHLTNNAVQCRYRNQCRRDKQLPDENMWDSYTFQAYLRTLGRRDEWESVVYPGMRESITGALLAAQDHMEPRQNCFELYGADFILTEDLKPWLIEINSSPAMSATTSVTARMCPQCLEDVIKVVIDRRTNRDAPTGQFELIYRQNVSTPQPYMGMNLTVRGSAAPRGKVAPPSWPSTEDAETPSHHDNIQTALDSLSDHLTSENDLLINSDERSVSSLEGEEGSNKDISELSERTGATLGRKRIERKCALYTKKHSCLSTSHRNFNSFGCTNRTHRLYKKQMRVNSVLLSMRRVSLVPTSDLLDWRQRAETARALCSSAIARMTGQIQNSQSELQGPKKSRPDWSKTKKSGRKKKSKNKDRAISVDEIRVWSELTPETEVSKALSDSENVKEKYKKNKTVIGLSRNKQIVERIVKRENDISCKGKLYQGWKEKAVVNEEVKCEKLELNENIVIEPIKDLEKTESKPKRKKKRRSPGRSPRSLSPSVNLHPSTNRPSRSLTTKRPSLSITKSVHKVDRSPSPAFRSLSPRISCYTPGYFDSSLSATSIEPNSYLRPFTSSDFNNNWHMLHGQSKYTFKSSSMINLPALLTK